MMPLTQMKKGAEAVVADLTCQGTCRQRLIDLGIIRGAKLTIRGYAPLGDPMIIEINDCEIAIRKKDAQSVLIM